MRNLNFAKVRLIELLIFLSVASVQGIAVSADVEYSIDPRAKPAIAKSVVYLKSHFGTQAGGYKSLVAYTLLKAGEPNTSAEIAAAIQDVRKKVGTTGYQPTNGFHGVYEASADMALLADANPGENRPTMEAILQFLVTSQRPAGFWTYPGEANGDTSMTQYAVLGLWAAERTGMKVPLTAWNNTVKWCLQNQNSDGGFAYHPGVTRGPAGAGSCPNMTFAGTACLFVARIYLYGDKPYYGQKEKPKPKKFGILDDVKAQSAQANWDDMRAKVSDIVPLAAIDQGIARGMGWVISHWTQKPINDMSGYFFYSLERVGALSASDEIGSHSWFNECLPVAIGLQAANGSWGDHFGEVAGTALTTLFLTRTTGRIIEKMSIAGGLQIGGRGLPDDLSKASVSKGKVKERKGGGGGLDDLLAELANQDATVLEDAQAAIVEKVQIGNREELLGQLETVRKLIKHPSAEVRRTAVWALGRSGQISDALLLIQALGDNDVDVLVEANASLKFLSRKLSGVGVPESPFEDIPEGATEQQKIAAVAAWRREALRRWSAWFSRVRPFEQRNDLFELLNRTLPDEK